MDQQTEQHSQKQQWKDITTLQGSQLLSQSTLNILSVDMGFENVTKVQSAVLPLFLSNKDVCVKACTGSGKTLAFVVPIVERLKRILNDQLTTRNVTKDDFSIMNKNQVFSIIIAPSRELVIQIFQVLNDFKSLFEKESQNELKAEEEKDPKNKDLKDYWVNFCYFIGGDKLDYDLQRINEKGANIVVSTPGRLFDLLERDAIDVSKMEVLIMDEADKMLAQGGNEVKMEYILKRFPKQRRTGLFSATMPTSLKNLIKSGMRNPFFVEVKQEDQGVFAIKNDNQQNVSITQFDQMDKIEMNDQIQGISEIPQNLDNFYIIFENQAEKLSGLLNFLENQIESSRIIIFFATCASVNYHNLLLKMLSELHMEKSELEIFKLHGKIDQKKRTKIYKQFRVLQKGDGQQVKKKHLVLLTTDLSSRGIDIPDVDWIIQFDPPQWSDSFVHRIGRAARAGQKGQSILFLNEPEDAYISFLQNKKVKIEDWPRQDKMQMRNNFSEVQKLIQKEMLQDKDMIDKSQDAFVSFIRYYKEHQLSFIFSFTLLDMGHAANSFFLFKIPRVKEILGVKLGSFEVQQMDLDTVPYKDANKGKQKEDLTNKRKEKMNAKFEEMKQENEKFKDLKAQKMANAKAEKQKRFEKTRQQKKKKRREQDDNEWDSLQKEENLYKKLKKGKISQKEFDKLVDGEENSDESD